MNNAIPMTFYVIILVALAFPLGGYIGKVMNGEPVFLSRILKPAEQWIYRLLHVDAGEQMSWKKYALCTVVFSVFCLIGLMGMQMIQQFLPGNPENLPNPSWHLAFNTAASFMTNTNWQAYSGESTLSYFTQMMGLTVQNFVSPAVGIAVLFVLIRGFVQVRKEGLGSFWTDVTRILFYILIPLSVVLTLGQVSQGVVQNFKPYETVSLVEPIVLKDGTTVTKQIVPMGPAASQIAIKQLGTNGGGFFGVNSAHPLENPTPFSNLLEMISLLLIPAALCFTFGRNVKDKRQGFSLFAAMTIVLVVCLGLVAFCEQNGTPQLAQNGRRQSHGG